MLRQVDLSKPPEHKVQEYAIEYKFPLDIFQEHAIKYIIKLIYLKISFIRYGI